MFRRSANFPPRRAQTASDAHFGLPPMRSAGCFTDINQTDISQSQASSALSLRRRTTVTVFRARVSAT